MDVISNKLGKIYDDYAAVILMSGGSVSFSVHFLCVSFVGFAPTAADKGGTPLLSWKPHPASNPTQYITNAGIARFRYYGLFRQSSCRFEKPTCCECEDLVNSSVIPSRFIHSSVFKADDETCTD